MKNPLACSAAAAASNLSPPRVPTCSLRAVNIKSMIWALESDERMNDEKELGSDANPLLSSRVLSLGRPGTRNIVGPGGRR